MVRFVQGALLLTFLFFAVNLYAHRHPPVSHEHSMSHDHDGFGTHTHRFSHAAHNKNQSHSTDFMLKVMGHDLIAHSHSHPLTHSHSGIGAHTHNATHSHVPGGGEHPIRFNDINHTVDELSAIETGVPIGADDQNPDEIPAGDLSLPPSQPPTSKISVSQRTYRGCLRAAEDIYISEITFEAIKGVSAYEPRQYWITSLKTTRTDETLTDFKGWKLRIKTYRRMGYTEYPIEDVEFDKNGVASIELRHRAGISKIYSLKGDKPVFDVHLYSINERVDIAKSCFLTKNPSLVDYFGVFIVKRVAFEHQFRILYTWIISTDETVPSAPSNPYRRKMTGMWAILKQR